MKGIIYKTDAGVVTIGAHIPLLNKLKAIFLQENPGMNPEDIEQLAMTVIAEKDIPRILPPDKYELWRTKQMSLSEYLTYPLPEYRIADASEWPADKVFRGAWNFDLKEDVVKAREIKKDMLRRDRTPIMAGLDVEFTRAMETGADTTNIVARKQVLRDITDLCDGAKTIDDLKKIACPV